VVQLLIHEIDSTVLPDEVQAAIRDGSIQLEHLLGLGQQANLNVVVSASHAYTRARTTIIGTYTEKSIQYGKFERGASLKVARKPSQREDLSETQKGADSNDDTVRSSAEEASDGAENAEPMLGPGSAPPSQ
jgi:hypothetical protein